MRIYDHLYRWGLGILSVINLFWCPVLIIIDEVALGTTCGVAGLAGVVLTISTSAFQAEGQGLNPCTRTKDESVAQAGRASGS